MSTVKDEENVRHKKSSTKVTPTKADHKHSYIRPFTMSHVRRFNGTISTEKYKFSLKDRCVDCGRTSRRRRNEALEVEISLKEYRRLKET